MLLDDRFFSRLSFRTNNYLACLPGLVPDNVPVKVEVQVQVPGNSGKPSFSEDED